MKLPKYPLPQHLGHKPIYAVPYQFSDGDPKGNTDAIYISLGLAQWDNEYISLKVWRHTGKKWSRQSEELPPHRPIDLTILLGLALLGHVRREEDLFVEKGTFDNQKDSDTIEDQAIRNSQEINQFHRALEKESERLKDRFQQLAKVIDSLRKNKVIK